MSSGAVVRYVDEVLGRAQSLFGQPEASGGSPARSAVSLVNGAGELVRGNATRIAPANGQFAATFTSFTNKAAPALDALAGLDDQLGRTLTDAANTDRTGRNDSGQVRNGAATDTRILGPVSGTPAGERALLVQLKGRLQQQQQVIAAYKARDARLAALVRSLSYRGRGSTGGGGGFSPASFGGIPRGSGGGSPGGGGSIPGLSALSSLPRVRQASNFAGGNLPQHPAARDVPSGPAGRAVAAALSKRGRPYVWGAKGPSVFDCSGLTQWAWKQAGVQLGPDTYTQINNGVPVAPGDVRAGDLIFPGYSKDGRGYGHVQLAISPTEVVHAPQTGDVVKISPMPKTFVARRPVPGPIAAV
ncbi:NlpC/P60 family protein [Mycolicibacterium mageritense]|uniref:NlpC/P60 family protein n=1 Tax=Mycolicibacterium mageritense TaxID=53462 RepID=UPI0027E303AE|nr:NlpC/P60 family protein [Mycolicibacterium mageritense]